MHSATRLQAAWSWKSAGHACGVLVCDGERRDHVSDCLFCKIADGSIPSQAVYADDHVLAFRDINPGAPVHVLLMPRRHVANLNDLGPDDAELAGHLMLTAARVARDLGVAESGYRVVANVGPDAGQSVNHLHWHILGGRGLNWPPG